MTTKNQEQIDYKEIDEGVRDLVYTLNQIPFVETLSSCEGHLKNSTMSGDTLPDEGHRFLTIGSMIFDVDEQHQYAKSFLDEVRKLGKKYSFTEFSEHACSENDCIIEGSFDLKLHQWDLTHAETIKKSDSLETMIKKRHQVETSVGIQRTNEYKKVWSDLQAIASKYAA